MDLISWDHGVLSAGALVALIITRNGPPVGLYLTPGPGPVWHHTVRLSRSRFIESGNSLPDRRGVFVGTPVPLEGGEPGKFDPWSDRLNPAGPEWIYGRMREEHFDSAGHRSWLLHPAPCDLGVPLRKSRVMWVNFRTKLGGVSTMADSLLR